MMQARPNIRVVLSTSLLAAAVLLSQGCSWLGAPGAVIARAIPRTRLAAYTGFVHQTVGVMCWADRGIRIDNPNLQLDVAAGIQEKLKTTQTADKPKELEGTTFPIAPRVIVRYQEDHPEVEGMSITETAGRFNFSRLVYVEVTDFATRSEASLELYRGTLTGNLKVIEIQKDGTAKVAYSENDIKVSFPKDTPNEGLPVGTDFKIYTGTIDKFTTEIVHRLAPFQEDPDEK